MSAPAYEKGLHEVADGVFAYLQPDGGWGWSNAGLIRGEGESLLVDTLFDLALTQDMLDAMSGVTSVAPVRSLVNTHANGDHCYGNQLVEGAEVIASEASAREMNELPPAALAAMMTADFGEEVNRYLQHAFGVFDFTNIDPIRVDRTFTETLEVSAGGRSAVLYEVGPAHTAGDVLVHLPDASTIFTGDILFIGGTPIIWDGPVANWVAACDRILELDCDLIVPGHGPLTDAAGVTAVRDYLTFLHAECEQRYAAGMSAADATRDIDLGAYKDWTDWERIAINVRSIYRELGSDEPTDVVTVFTEMANIFYR